MNRSRDSSALQRTLARFTPDSRRWRRYVAGLTAVGSVLSFYAAFAVASGVKSGMIYDLLIVLFAFFTLTLPAIASATLLAPDSGLARTDTSHSDGAVETLKRRYAAGEIDRGEFDRRLDDLLASVDARDEAGKSVETRPARGVELESTGE